MLHGDINAPQTYERFLTNPVFQAVLLWFRDMLPKQPPVRKEGYPIFGEDVFALVQNVMEKPRHELKFERHFQFLDFQGCFSSEEIIAWLPVSDLGTPIKVDQENDYAHFSPPDQDYEKSSVYLNRGKFVIFDTDDGHAPAYTCNDSVGKVVIKIRKDLLAQAGRPPLMVVGPFETGFDYNRPLQGTFDELVRGGLFKSVDELVTAERCLTKNAVGVVRKNVYLANFTKPLPQSDVPSELQRNGWKILEAEHLLNLNALYPHLLEHRVSMVAPCPTWEGREQLKDGTRLQEALCLHNDNGMRRLRSHPATTWGPHTWYAVEQL